MARYTLNWPRDVRCSPEGGGATHPEWLRPAIISLTIVCGPPGSGKTTWARRRALAGALILDLDEIKSEIFNAPPHVFDPELVGPALRVRNDRLDRLSRPSRIGQAFLIVSEPTAAGREWWDKKLRPTSIVVCETPEDECHRRIALDPSRAAVVAEHRRLVSLWWAAYTRRPGDRIAKPSAPEPKSKKHYWGFA
jgi:5-methylcytosine-specific restriction protein A